MMLIKKYLLDFSGKANSLPRKTIYAVSLASCCILFGCDSHQKQESTANTLAIVNDVSLTEADLMAYMKIKKLPVEDAERKAQALSQLVEREALASSIAKLDFLDSAEIEMEVAEFRRQALISRYFEKFVNEKVKETAVRNFYTANQEHYKSQQVNMAHNLLRTKAQTNDKEDQDMCPKSNEAMNKGRKK